MIESLTLRARAAEHLIRVLSCWIDDDVLDDAAATLLAELSNDLTPEERALREAALDMLTHMDAGDLAVLLKTWPGSTRPE